MHSYTQNIKQLAISYTNNAEIETVRSQLNLPYVITLYDQHSRQNALSLSKMCFPWCYHRTFPIFMHGKGKKQTFKVSYTQSKLNCWTP